MLAIISNAQQFNVNFMMPTTLLKVLSLSKGPQGKTITHVDNRSTPISNLIPIIEIALVSLAQQSYINGSQGSQS